MPFVTAGCVLGLVLFLGGMVVAGPFPSLGVPMVCLGAVMVGVTPFFINRAARRSPGWTRVWNPGAARREHRRERWAGDEHDGERSDAARPED